MCSLDEVLHLPVSSYYCWYYLIFHNVSVLCFKIYDYYLYTINIKSIFLQESPPLKSLLKQAHQGKQLQQLSVIIVVITL